MWKPGVTTAGEVRQARVFSSITFLGMGLLLADTLASELSGRQQNFGVLLMPQIAAVIVMIGSGAVFLRAGRNASGESSGPWTAAIVVPILAAGFILAAYRAGPVTATIVAVPAFAVLGGVRRPGPVLVATGVTVAFVILGFLRAIGTWFPPDVWLF